MNSESDLVKDPFYPTCKLWRQADPDDADSQAAGELGKILSGESSRLLCLSGDIAQGFKGQPFSNHIAPADWLMSEPALISRYHKLYRLSGAACAVTYTEHCAPLDVDAQGLHGATEAAARAAVRAAFSAAPLFVMGYVGPQPLPNSFDPNYEEIAYNSWLELIKIFNVTRVHGLLISDLNVREAEIALKAAKSLLTVPCAVCIKIDSNSLQKKDGFIHATDADGIYLDEAYERLARLGADSIGISGVTPKELESIAKEVVKLSKHYGAKPICRLSMHEDAGLDNFDIPLLRAMGAGIHVMGMGKGSALELTGRLADDMSQFGQAAKIEFVE